jgi:proton-translocating NADH-quinone oxidoreductase chain L
MTDWPGWLYVAAVLIPLGAFLLEALFGRWLGRLNAYVATAAIGTSCVLSVIGLLLFLPHFGGAHGPADEGHGEAEAHAAAGEHGGGHHEPFAWRGSVPWTVVGPMGVGPEMPGRADRPLPALVIPLGVHIDGLAVIMFAMVTFIATLIHVYSMGYMADDPRYPRFFTYLSLFCFSMLGLVASANVFMVFMFWELVGVCSYLLIGFWYEDKKNSDAANKAFIVNRVGDVGMLVGLGILWSAFGTFTIADLNRALAEPAIRDDLHRLTRTSAGDDVMVHLTETVPGATDGTPTAPRIPYGLLVIAGLGIFAGCVGKSAQFPLHVWLPDAMAGPTPVSALIHAATMVAAGVYLVGRFYPLFTHEVLLYIAYTGGITLLIGATIALVQSDYKKVLAYSTVSQLGFMMLGLGVGGWAAGLFHLITHAFFKALLFLSAGSVYHSVHTYEMPVLGGLRAKMPRTSMCMLIGTLAIAGVPFFSGFYSKDAILASALHFVREHPRHFLVFVLPALGAVLTAFYMFRMWFLIFDGEARGYPAAHQTVVEVEHGSFEAEPGHGHGDDHGASHAHAHGHDHGHPANPVDHAHESPPVMTVPLMILAAFSIFVGYPLALLPIPGLPAEWTTPVLERAIESAEPLPALDVGESKWLAVGASVLIAAVGIAGAAGFYSRWRIFNPEAARRGLAPLHAFFARKWYFDELYDAVLVRPTLAVARWIRGFDLAAIDGVVNGSARLTRRLSDIGGLFDRYVVDGAVHAVALVLGGLGLLGRSLQTGQLRTYLTLLALAVVGLFVGMYVWAR